MIRDDAERTNKESKQRGIEEGGDMRCSKWWREGPLPSESSIL